VLDKQFKQHDFMWFRDLEGISNLVPDQGWSQQALRLKLTSAVPTLQVSIGWKINWETKQEFWMDDVIVMYS
jgi:hypothetical protein